jgi:hypothetical protein
MKNTNKKNKQNRKGEKIQHTSRDCFWFIQASGHNNFQTFNTVMMPLCTISSLGKILVHRGVPLLNYKPLPVEMNASLNAGGNESCELLVPANITR